MRRSTQRVAHRYLSAMNLAGLTFYHGTYLKDALAIKRDGFRLNRGRGRGAFLGAGVYVSGNREWANGCSMTKSLRVGLHPLVESQRTLVDDKFRTQYRLTADGVARLKWELDREQIKKGLSL